MPETEKERDLPDWLDDGVQSPEERCADLMARARKQIRHTWSRLSLEDVEARTERAKELGVDMRDLMEGDPADQRLYDLVVAFGLVNEGVSVRHFNLRTEEGVDAARTGS